MNLPPLPDYLSYYNPAWPDHARAIIDRLDMVLGHRQRIEHIGSTNIPGMVAKPIIDVDVFCRDDLPAVIRALAAAGYAHQGDLGIVGREAFRVDPSLDLPAHHLYAGDADAREMRRHLGFRDYLRAHPERARWLSERKCALARGLSRADYIREKAGFYAVIMTEVEEWAPG